MTPSGINRDALYPPIAEYSALRKVSVMKGAEVEDDVVIAEEPLQISIETPQGVKPLATTMRTPGDDLYLSLGYLLSEGIQERPRAISRPASCEKEDNNSVILEFKTSPLGKESKHTRLGMQSSSCGVCGKTSLESLLNADYRKRPQPDRRWERADLHAISRCISREQPLFSETGGSHSVWLFDQENTCVASFEDVGRHNALDKLLGWASINDLTERQNMTLVLSSRLSYELVHKTAVLGVWVIIALGAPSSLAVELANKLELTTLGFFKEHSFNLYTNRLAFYYERA